MPSYLKHLSPLALLPEHALTGKSKNAFMTTENPISTTENDDLSVYQAARLAKLRKIEAMGIDPWGHRFDNRILNRELRAMADQVKFRKSDGQELALPNFDGENPVDYKAWKAEQGDGRDWSDRSSGRADCPHAFGRQVVFLNIRDWSGDIQIMISKAQVGDENFELTKHLDFGDLVGVDGRLGRTNTGELTIIATKLTFLTKTMEPPPESMRLDRS